MSAKKKSDVPVEAKLIVPAKRIEKTPVKYSNDKIQIESSVDVIGPNNDPNVEAKRFRVTFPKPFQNIPQVTANTLQDPNYPFEGKDAIDDTFAVSLTSITREGFTGQVVRVDQDDIPNIRLALGTCTALARPALPTWGQNLLLSWIAVGKRCEK